MDDPLQLDQKPLVDRYKELLAELGGQAVADQLAKIETCLWYGRPGSAALFAEELQEVRDRGARQREDLHEQAPDLLILCVGYSPEPLLLAVAHHAPAEVLLLKEEGLQPDYLASLAKLWKRYRPANLPEQLDDLHPRIVRDDAVDLFRSVREILRQRPQGASRIVLDITGAKKSMVAGGFLAAGFLGLETSYVDFAKYDPVLRRPFPGTSRPGRLEHPYSLFKLREEARLAEEFDRGNFREAETLAKALGEMARSPEVANLLPPGEASSWEQWFGAVERVAHAYRHWSEGFYAESAEELRTEAGIVPLPATVEWLGSVWPRSTDSHQAIVAALLPRNVFADASVVLAYFLDVLVWTQERLEERPREIFLRLYGTVESVIFFAFHVLVTRRPERLQIETEEIDKLEAVKSRFPKKRRGEDLDWEQFLRGVAIEGGEDNSRRALELLAGGSYRTGPKINTPRGLKGWPPEGVEALPACSIRLEERALPQDLFTRLFGDSAEEGIHFGTFNTLRHKAVHWLAPVPAQMAAKLLEYYRTVIKVLVPAVVSQLREDELDAGVRGRLDEWETRLLEAAGGRIAQDCRPLPYREVKQAEVRHADLRGR